MKKKLIMLMAALIGGISFAETDGVYNGVKYSTSRDIVPGEWNCNFSLARSYASEHDLPLLVYWSNHGCSYCSQVETELSRDVFTDWQKNGLGRSIVMVFVVNGIRGGDGGYGALSAEALAARSYIKDLSRGLGKKLSQYPFLSVSYQSSAEAFSCRKNEIVMSAETIIDEIGFALRGFPPSYDRDSPKDVDIDYGFCKKSHFLVQEGTNWFRLAAVADVKYAVRLLAADERYSDYRFSFLMDDSSATRLSSGLGEGCEFLAGSDRDVLFGIEAVRADGEKCERRAVEFDLQHVAMESDTSTCFPEVSMRMRTSDQDAWRECVYGGWNIVPSGADVSGVATQGKVLWSDEDRGLDYPNDLLKSESVRVESKKTIWMQSIVSGYVRSEKVCASFALGKCNMPTCSHEPVTGSYGPQRVTLAADPETVIRYTLDRSDVTEGSPVYAGVFEVQETTKVNARAYRADWVESDCATFVVEDGRKEIGEQMLSFRDYYLDDGQLKVPVVVHDADQEEYVLTADDYSVSFSVQKDESGEGDCLVVHFQGFGLYKGEYDEIMPFPSDRFAEIGGKIWFWREKGGAAEIVSGPMYADELVVPSEIDGRPVTAIGEYAFYGTPVRRLVVPSCVTRIAEGAFWWCEDLESVEGGDGLEFMGCDAFAETPFLAQLEEAAQDGSLIMVGGCVCGVKGELSGRVVLPEETRGISDEALRGQGNLTEVVLPDGIRAIGKFAFADCESLFDINFPDALVWVDECAFENTGFLSARLAMAPANSLVIVGNVLLGVKGELPLAVKIPENVKGIAARAFESADCPDEIMSVVLPEGLQAIAPFAFGGCWTIQSVDLPESITRLAWDSFNDSGILAVLVANDGEAARIRAMLQGNDELVVLSRKDLAVVRLDPNGGTLMGPDTLTPLGFYGALPEPVRIGADFIGWTDQDLQEIVDPWDAHIVMEGDEAPSSNVVLHALWEMEEPYWDGDAEWWIENEQVLCGVGLSGGDTACFYEVPGRGWVNFKWRIVALTGGDAALAARGMARSSSDDDWWGYGCDGYSFSLRRLAEGQSSDSEWHAARVPVANGDSSEFAWQIVAPQTCCEDSSFEYWPEVRIEISDIVWEPADALETQITLELCGAESMYLNNYRRFCFAMNSEGVFWWQDMLEANGETPEWWSPELYPHLVVVSKGGGASSLRATCSKLSELTEDEVSLLEMLTQEYCYRSGSTWCVDISLLVGEQIPWTENAFTRRGQYGRLPEPEREGCEFLGWTLERYRDPYSADIVDEEDWMPLDGKVTLYAVWDVPPELALDAKGTITDDEAGTCLEVYCSYSVDAKWKWDRDSGVDVYDGEMLRWDFDSIPWWMHLGYDYPETDQYDDPEERYYWLEENALVRAYVRGCGILRVEDMRSRYSGFNLVAVVDGVEQELQYDPGFGYCIDVRKRAGIGVFWDGELSEEDEDYDLHEIMIVVENSRKDDETWCYGELGAMEWIPVSDPVEVMFDARGGNLSGTSVRTYAPGDRYGSLPSVMRAGFEFIGWYTEPGGGTYVSADDLVWLSCPTLYARWRSDDLVNTLGGGKLRFATKGEYGWEVTSAISHGSNCCAAATTSIMWGETNRLTTVVQGPGVLKFWWMQGEDVSDFNDASLCVIVDGRTLVCSEHSKWCSMAVPILGRGNHTVVWCYTPGAYTRTYSDLWDEWTEEQMSSSPHEAWDREKPYLSPGALPPGAWVDGVEWVQAGNVKDIVTWASGIVQGRAWLTDVLPLIEAEYTAKIADEPLNYEWRVLRAITKLFGLGENENLKAVLAQFGLAPDYQVLGNFFGELDYFDAPLSNEIVDALAAEAVPVLESALADLDAIPDDWTGSIPLNPAVYPVDVVTYVDLADVTLYKAALKGALSALAIAEGYDLSVDYMNGEMEEILAEAGLPVTFEYLVEDHPEFAKRVRDAERLGEGKEILRDALETLQVFDGLMLARTTSEMHFFEYDEKDADKQQYAREEVAKMLVALDGETDIRNDDFRYVRNFTVSEMNQPATLVPFFSGNVTRRYLPTEIHDNHPVFDSFPTMSFGGTFPGLTKDTVAGWLAENGREVEYTPDSDYEPEVLFRTFNAVIPNLGASATEEEIEDALAGTADAKVKANITDAKSYAAYETWATKVQSAGIPLKAVKASSCSWQSFALAAPGLMQDEITDDDLKVDEFKPSSESGKFDFTVSVKDVTVGSEAVEENLKQVIGLEGAESLGDAFKSENVAIKFGQPEDGKLKFTAEPKNAEAKSFFMKMKVK